MKADVRKELLHMYEILLAAHGHRHWWPAKTRFEVVVGAVLTQNTSWKNVEKAISSLKERGRLTIEGLAALAPEDMAKLIRPAGYYNLKARRLKNVVEWWKGNHRKLAGMDTETIRDELLQVNGVGPETADSILLYALGRPVFVIDAYTRRIAKRTGLGPWYAPYDVLRKFFEDNLPRDPNLYNDFHAQLVHLGNTVCKARPVCGRCPVAASCKKLV